jgi:hypothetical protein
MSDGDLDFVPPTFALHAFPEDESTPVIVGWGMTLPDGSAIAIGWDEGRSSSVAICRSPASASFIFNADVAWVGQADR